MPQFHETTPTMDREYAGHAVKVPLIYTEGQTLTPELANFLNGQLAVVVGNQWGSDLRRAKEAAAKEGKPEPVLTDPQASFDAKFAAYTPGVRGSGSTSEPTDPLAKFMRAIATERVKALLISKGKSVGAVQKAKDADGNSVFSTIVTAYLERNHAEIEPFAQRQLDAQKEAASIPDASDDDLLADVA